VHDELWHFVLTGRGVLISRETRLTLPNSALLDRSWRALHCEERKGFSEGSDVMFAFAARGSGLKGNADC
jgi:hypothetical protein